MSGHGANLWRCVAVALSLLGCGASVAMAVVAAPGPAPTPGRGPAPQLRAYETPYYRIHTDLDPPVAAEAVVRMTRLAEEYRTRTRALGFTGRIRQRLPVYLFKDREDYLATGAPPESAGAFLGDRVVAVATDNAGGPAWHVVQHEAFHQFSAAVEGPELPGWVTEGLGEYFGEALFTGDGFVTGVVPAWRARRVKKSIREGTFKPLDELLRMSQEDWNQKVEVANYDQAWSVVHVTQHAQGDRGRQALAAFVKSVASGKAPQDALAEHFGGAPELGRRWRDYWLAFPDDGSPGRYAEAAVAAATSLLARAEAAGQSFASADEFFEASRRGRLRCRPDDWLPVTILHYLLHSCPAGVKWSLGQAPDGTRVAATLAGGPRLTGRYRLENGRVTEVVVTIDLSPERGR